MEEKINRKAKNKIEKIIKVFNKTFVADLYINKNIITSTFFHIQVENSGVVYLSPCLNKNFSTFLCLFLVRLADNGIKQICIREGYSVDSEKEEVISESETESENLKNASNSEFKFYDPNLSYADQPESTFTVVGDVDSEDFSIVYKDNIILKRDT